mgnify:CR=1 FL=1
MIAVNVEELTNSYKVRFPYNVQAVERIKTIPGRQFRKDMGNAWLVPKISQRALERFMLWASGKEVLSQIQRVAIDPEKASPTCTKGDPLWKHQLAAYRYLVNREASLLDLAMGSGKSRVLVDYVHNTSEIRRVLILCPKSFVQGWRGQFDKHGGRPVVMACLDASAGTVSGRVQAGKHVLADAAARNLVGVVVVNYDVIWRDDGGMAEWLLDTSWDVVVCDEVQRVRNSGTAASKFAYRLGAASPVRIGLSGTPFPESPLDAFGVCRFLDASVFGTSFVRFRSRYAVMGGFENRVVAGYINQTELKAKINSIRFTMEPEGYELPDAHDIIVPLVLPEKVQKLYRTLERDLYAKVGTGEIVLSNSAVAFGRLQQLTGGVLPIDDTDGVREIKRLHSTKADALQDILESLAPTEPVVVIARFREDLKRIHEVATACGRISGEVSGRSSKPEAHIANGVWVGPENVLAVQAQSGVEGLDLTRAHIMIFLSYGLELGKYEQARARIRRAGQTEKCLYYHLLCTGTVDEKIQKLLERKQHVLQGLLGGAQPRMS